MEEVTVSLRKFQQKPKGSEPVSHLESRGLCTRQRAQPVQRPRGGTVPGLLEMTGVSEGKVHWEGDPGTLDIQGPESTIAPHQEGF